jgi:hypothetical protein
VRAERLPLRLRAAVVLIAAGAVCRTILEVTTGGDYQPGKAVGADNAAPAIDALIHGHLGTLAAHQPLMGLVSLVWRAPFSGAAVWLGGSPRVVFQCGVLGCLMSALAAAWWLTGRARSLFECGAAAAAAAIIAGGPITLAATQYGHPEEVLTALLAAMSVICAACDRPRSAAVLLGLAIGSKPWAVLATPCVLLALPRSRLAVTTLAAAVAAPTVALLPLLNLAAYERASRVIGALDYVYPYSLWWPLDGRRVAASGVPAHLLPLSLTRTGATAIVFAVTAALLCAYSRRAHHVWRIPSVDGLALLCLLGLVRCLADPAPVTYYFAALVIPLALWEAGTRRRFPVLALLVSIVADAVPKDVLALKNGVHGPLIVDVLNAAWLVAGIALGLYLARSAIRPWAEARAAGQEGRASGWRGSPSSGTGSQAAA